MRRLPAIVAVLAALSPVAFITIESTTLRAQERSTKVVANRPARIYVFAGFDTACQSLTGLAIEIARAPTKGQVALREGQETTIMNSASGKCVGTRQKGTGIYYTAAPGAQGSDTFAVTARIGDNPPVTRTFTVAIAED